MKRRDQPPQEDVSGRWLVKALLATVLLAGVALYCTICLLFYQGQWQFVFSRRAPAAVKTNSAAPPSLGGNGLPLQHVHFDYTEEGHPQLEGWWIAAPGGAPGKKTKTTAPLQPSITILFCPSAQSTPAENLPAVRALHALGASVFLFDYRGFNAGDAGHPSQRKAYQDGATALAYLTSERHIPLDKIVLYGAEAGAAVAAHVAQDSSGIAALVMEDPQLSLAAQVKREQHIHVLPMSIIFTDRFSIASVIPSLHMPKLIIATGEQPAYPEAAAEVFARAARPKTLVHLAATSARALYSSAEWQQAVSTFLSTATIQSH